MRDSFRSRREQLEAQFFGIVSNSGRPRGLEWVDCQFEDEVVFARMIDKNELTALVGLSIKFEAIPGGGMEEVEAVENRKVATALFLTVDKKWTTEGRAIMNLEPAEAVTHFGGQLALLDEKS